MLVSIISLYSLPASAINIIVDGKHGVANFTCCMESKSYPCKTLTLALECIKTSSENKPVSLIINEGQYTLVNNYSLTLFEGQAGMTIAGNCQEEDNCVKISCEKGAGLTFIKSDNIKLENLVLAGCGFPNNSTSLDLSGHKTFIIANSALYFLLCQTVSLSHITVRESNELV